MSFIRMGQEGSYVDIPGGSNYYLYDNGNDIEGWSYGQFAALIGQVADEIELPQDDATEIKAAFRSHFEGWDPDYKGGITPPERGEIFCQCVNRRINDLELTDELQQSVQDWVDEFDAMRECEYCGEEIRPFIYHDDTRYVCDKDKCEKQSSADHYDVDVSVIERGERIFYHLHYDYDWDLNDATQEEMDFISE